MRESAARDERDETSHDTPITRLDTRFDETRPATRPRPGHHPRAPGFVEHVCESSFRIRAPWPRVWGWLETPATFADGQVWPFRVEFPPNHPSGPAGFEEGAFSNHHGPLLNLPGRLDTIFEGDDRAYRSLEYLYGSFVVSLRFVRPTRLEFWVDGESDATTRVRLRLSSDVRPLLETGWGSVQRVFWRRFPRWMAKALDAELVG